MKEQGTVTISTERYDELIYKSNSLEEFLNDETKCLHYSYGGWVASKVVIKNLNEQIEEIISSKEYEIKSLKNELTCIQEELKHKKKWYKFWNR